MHEEPSSPERGPTRLQPKAPAHGAPERLPIDPELPEADHADRLGMLKPRHGAGRAGVVAVAAGGFLGAVARYGLEQAVPASPTGFPLTTWLINTSGAFALGVILMVLVQRRPERSSTARVRAFACTGALGAWTTVSTFASEVDGLVRVGRPGMAAGYLVATFASGVVGTAAGIGLVRRRGA